MTSSSGRTGSMMPRAAQRAKSVSEGTRWRTIIPSCHREASWSPSLRPVAGSLAVAR